MKPDEQSPPMLAVRAVPKSELLTVKEAARFLRISPWTLYTWTSSRMVPHIRLGRKLFFDPEELRHWIESRKVKAKRTSP